MKKSTRDHPAFYTVKGKRTHVGNMGRCSDVNGPEQGAKRLVPSMRMWPFEGHNKQGHLLPRAAPSADGYQSGAR